MSSSHERYTACWHADAPRVLAFARRHVGDDAAQDVVAETFLVAWRRWDTVPDPAIGWLILTARKVMSNRIRSVRRQRALAERIALLDHVASYAAETAEATLTRREALPDQQREALLLVAWDGLSTDDAAEALGIRPAAFRKRLSRARAALTTPRSTPSTDPARPSTVLQEL